MLVYGKDECFVMQMYVCVHHVAVLNAAICMTCSLLPHSVLTDIHGSEHNLMTDMGWKSVLRLALDGMQFCNITVWDIFFRHAMVGTQFYDMPSMGHSFTICSSLDAVLRHALVTSYILSKALLISKRQL